MCRSEELSLHSDAFDLHEKSRASQLTDTYASPCTDSPGKDFILHASENGHMAMHIDVISGHFDNICKIAATGFQYESQILPCR